jgi:hypothetical protein
MNDTKPKHDRAAKAGKAQTNAEQAAERAETERQAGAEQLQAENARLSVESHEQEPGAVLDELSRGYRWGEELLRPARVRVAR